MCARWRRRSHALDCAVEIRPALIWIAAALGGTLTASADPGATLRVPFQGTGIRVLYSRGPEGGFFSGWVDAGPLHTAEGYAESYSYGYVLAFEGLPAGDHALTVTNGDGAIWIEAIEVQGVLVEPPPMLTPIVPTPSSQAGASEPHTEVNPLVSALEASAPVDDYVVLEAIMEVAYDPNPPDALEATISFDKPIEAAIPHWCVPREDGDFCCG